MHLNRGTSTSAWLRFLVSVLSLLTRYFSSARLLTYHCPEFFENDVMTRQVASLVFPGRAPCAGYRGRLARSCKMCAFKLLSLVFSFLEPMVVAGQFGLHIFFLEPHALLRLLHVAPDPSPYPLRPWPATGCYSDDYRQQNTRAASKSRTIRLAISIIHCGSPLSCRLTTATWTLSGCTPWLRRKGLRWH